MHHAACSHCLAVEAFRTLGALGILGVVMALVPAGPGLAGAAEEPGRAGERKAMVERISEEAKGLDFILDNGGLDQAVAEAMRRVPRHEFVPEEERERAYENAPLPIGFGQTISQPVVVAIMTDLLDIEPGSKVLEVGTGSGYQAAVLAALGARVHSIEIIPELAEFGRENLERAGFGQVAVHQGDGYYGLEQEAPFEAIIVTAAASHIPPPLVEQLAPGGHMAIPVGGQWFTQQLNLVEKGPDGAVTTRQLLPVAFVPLR
ncbi:protein-L-isoaspartate(D-aspartate) O-methyltransferase [Desulfocurvibacter africanus]|uniref:Protein-L-isoaspartate O-methyltransferase n=1 Tax=Desulfocurvibacter africanus subsp. africanus str. Walvis Bay TaxID=690850 RepID=F3Z472_DESAF|nr:protein-L-isoaspartate(D-aspartate) O-methyltransferase [Desulfocurvibacter africanus]EGJ51614.1 Protein-L-isoaspartate O-methyltransferase [Desulfocurvibacter africanus subsp. africanus str. Walvis Bay]